MFFCLLCRVNSKYYSCGWNWELKQTNENNTESVDVSLSWGVHFVQYQLIFTENIYIKMDLSAEWMNSFSHFARTVNACSGKLDAYRTGSHPEQKS